MRDVQIYHNPRCSKSRQTFELLRAKNIEPDIILYLENPPSVAELTGLLEKLGMRPADILRRSEADFKRHFSDLARLSDAQIISRMHSYPKVIERPIVVNGHRAAIGRPPEQVLTIL